MNRIITICATILMTASTFAQTPERMSYQAVIRDNSGELAVNQNDFCGYYRISLKNAGVQIEKRVF